MPVDVDAKSFAAESWYGYGRWDAPFWFIGPEPGMKQEEGDNLLARCQAWQLLGSPELLDCVAHHRAFGHMTYHTRTMRMKIPVETETMRPPTQDTWRRLIRLLLAFKGERTDHDAIGDYQCDAWGSASGETCLLELSALAARSLLVKRDRTTFRRERSEHLRMRLLENAPRFVIMYGLGARDVYERIAGSSFDANGYAWSGSTLCALVEHPTAIPGKSADWWIAKGRETRDMITMRATA